MNSVIVAYDRHRRDNYKPLIDALEAMGAQRLQYSLWEIKGTSDANGIGEKLRRFLDTGDRLDTFATGIWRFTWPPFRSPFGMNALGGLGRSLAQ